MASEEKSGFAKVKGVLQGNSDIREEILRHIYWKDKTYTDYANGILRYADIKTRDVSPLTGGKELLDYTHDGSSPLSADVRRKYGTADAEVYEVTPYPQELRKWVGDYRDTFDVHNRLGQVGDIKYAEGMTMANYANSDRHIEEKYLTPKLIGFYGSNQAVDRAHRFITAFNNINGEYNPDGGRMSDIPETNNVKIVHKYKYSDSSEGNGGNYYLDKQLHSEENSGRFSSNFEDNRRYTNEYDDVYYHDKSTADFKSYSAQKGIDANPLQRYDEGDVEAYYMQDEGDVGEITHLKNNENYAVLTKFTGQSLLTKTNEMFKKHKIETLIGRFHTTEHGPVFTSMTDTAKHPSTLGNSHGRNLLKKNYIEQDNNTNGYDNPYCRVWTYHHQYDKVKRLIRPFMSSEDAPLSKEDIQKINSRIRSHGRGADGTDILDGGKYLADNTVLNSNGFVNIAPSQSGGVDIKKCMFSIENLAWKDVVKKDEYLSKEQQGPNGGRIMWFPPYDLDFQEGINVDWDANSFIGRGERVYTYRNTDRTGTLSFTLLIDHPGVIDLVNKYSISNPEGDGSNDILRFFAGCQQLEITDKELVEEVHKEQISNTDEGKVVTPKDKVEHIKFYIYFPNNYSGNHLQTTKKTWEQNGPSDEDWLKYLLYGTGTDVDEGYMNGYEMIDEPLSGSDTPIYPNPTISKCSQWELRDEIAKGKGPYHHRVDFDLRQVLFYDKNYIDNNSFHLNSKLNETVSKGANYSFAEVALALLTFDKQNKADFGLEENEFAELEEMIIDYGEAREDKVTELVNMFSGLSSVASVIIKGAATKQDSKVRQGCEYTDNVLLAKRRARSAFALIQQMLLNRVGEKAKDAEISYSEIEEIERLKDMTDVNTLEAKAQRYAVVEITLNEPEVKKVSESESTENYTTAVNNEIHVEYAEDADIDPDSTYGGTLEAAVKTAERVTKTTTSDIPAGTIATGKTLTEVKRYETEAEYFDKLAATDAFVYKTIKEKFKYFTPAFHSMSPEGFNARLNFLHQCTRQGHTIEASAKGGYSVTAGNLSFGRMPVCVLKIGDFINTRIIINNITINYGEGGIQWDLNPEGAGVQPMFAKVSMGITILGGQSLTGPINRLQNAISFDYYANTGVYDDRADRINIGVSSDENGQGKITEEYTHLWTPHPSEIVSGNEKTLKKK